MKSPSVSNLREIFGDDNAPAAKRILKMTRAQLEELPAGADRVKECYHAPSTADIRLHCLNALGEFYGVEAIRLKSGEWLDYLNAGDAYAATLVRFRGNYYVATWGDYVERYGD